MKSKLLIILYIALISGACKKTTKDIVIENPPPPAGQLKLPHGEPLGDAVTKEIGTNGGSLQSADGIMKITVPEGAVLGPIVFSIQEVQNVLGGPAKSYRLKPEGIAFKKPITVTYKYGSIKYGGADPKTFFLACQNEQGYFFSAKQTKGNRTNNTLTVETIHFSDWTFYTLYRFASSKTVSDEGKISLSENEKTDLTIERVVAKPSKNTDLDELLVPITDPIISAARWELIPRKGTLTVTQISGKAEYRAPASIPQLQEVVVTAMMTGDLGKDNEGNPVRQMQLSQAIDLLSEDYFIMSIDGAEMQADDFTADATPLAGIGINAHFPNGYNLSSYIYETSPGGYSYREHGSVGYAALELVTSAQKSFIVFRPKRCDGIDNELIYSDGKFVITAVPQGASPYFEGNFTATLFSFGYCEKPETKTISGKFRIKKKI